MEKEGIQQIRRELFEMQDLIVVGHTVDSDAKFLNDEAKRYNKPFFNYKFYDAKYNLIDAGGFVYMLTMKGCCICLQCN